MNSNVAEKHYQMLKNIIGPKISARDKRKVFNKKIRLSKDTSVKKTGTLKRPVSGKQKTNYCMNEIN